MIGISKFAWHVTPSINVDSIFKTGLKPHSPEPDGDFAISLFKTQKDAFEQTNLWLRNKWSGQSLTILCVNICDLHLTETSKYEIVTTNAENINPNRISIACESFELQVA